MLVVAELVGVTHQFRLQMGLEGSVCLSVAGELVWGGDVMRSTAAGRARTGCIRCEVQACCEPSDLRLLLNRVGLLVFQIGFQPGDLDSDLRYCVGCGSACFEDFEEVLAAEDCGEVSDVGRGESCRSLAFPCGNGLDEVKGALVETHDGHAGVFCAHVFCRRSNATQPSVTVWSGSCLKVGCG